MTFPLTPTSTCTRRIFLKEPSQRTDRRGSKGNVCAVEAPSACNLQRRAQSQRSVLSSQAEHKHFWLVWGHTYLSTEIKGGDVQKRKDTGPALVSLGPGTFSMGFIGSLSSLRAGSVCCGLEGVGWGFQWSLESWACAGRYCLMLGEILHLTIRVHPLCQGMSSHTCACVCMCTLEHTHTHTEVGGVHIPTS